MAWTRLTHPEYFMLAITRASEICIGIGAPASSAVREPVADGAIACVTVGRFSGIVMLISSR